MLGTLGRLWGVSGRLVGPKWPPGWLQEDAKWAPDVPRSHEKAAKSWLLDRQNRPERALGHLNLGPKIPKLDPKVPKFGAQEPPKKHFLEA